MAETFELNTFKFIDGVNDDSNIEEYEEVGVDLHNNIQREFYPIFRDKISRDYDFFTKYNVDTSGKEQKRKKKTKRKIKRANIMDIINSELALIENPIRENVVTVVDFTNKYSMCLKTDNIYSIRKPWQWNRDAEIGRKRYNELTLSTVFTKIIQSVINETTIIPVEYVKAIKFNDFINNDQRSYNKDFKLLDVEIHNVQFKCYHKLSLEELLSEKLLELHKDYKNIQDNLKIISKDLKVNRNTKDKYKEEISNITNKKGNLKFDPTLRKYTEKGLIIKEKYFEYLKLERQTLNKIVSLWSDIEMVRLKYNCIKSSYDLEISKLVLDEDVYEEEWNMTFNREYSDLLDKVEYDYVTKCIEYKKQKNEEKADKTSKRKLSRPKLDLNEEEMKQQIYEIVQRIVTKERKVVKINFNNDMLIDQKTVFKQKANYKDYFSLKIFVDDMFVCETKSCNIETNLEVNLSDYFSVQIMPNNKNFTFHLCENGIKQSEYKINILNINKNTFNGFATRICFKYELQIEPNNKSIGCGYMIKDIAKANGIRLKSSNVYKETVRTICEVAVKIGWNVERNQLDSEYVRNYLEISTKLKQPKNSEELSGVITEVIEKMYGTTMDNENENLSNILKIFSKMNLNHTYEAVFPINENTFDIDRLKLLHLRNNGELLELKSRLIPLHSSQISTEQLNILQKLKDNQLDEHQASKERYSEMDPIEMQRYIGIKYIENLNKNMLKNVKDNLMRNSYRDIVCDFKDLNFRNLFKSDTNLTANVPNGRTYQMDGINKDIEIYVTVVRAFNLPDRTAPILSDEHDEDDIAGFKVRPLRPFVRIHCQDISVQSASAIGCHPTWNQTLCLKTKAGSATTLEINIYDQVKVNITDAYTDDDVSLGSKTVHYRFYNKWLGSVHIPLYAVLSLGKVQGIFKINTPPLLLSYESTSKSPQMHLPNVNQFMKKDTAYITLKLSTSHSHLVGLSHNQPNPGSDDYIIKHLNDFVTSYEINFPLRHISLTFINSVGCHNCTTQFLQPIPPPDSEYFPKNSKSRIESAMSKSSGISKSSSTKSFESKKHIDVERSVTPRSVEKDSLYSGYEGKYGRRLDNDMEKLVCACLRYTSLIPTYEVTEQYNVTLMGWELLKVLHGSPLDHSLLLASYFLYLGIKTWIVMGLGIPRGLTSYVLVKYNQRTNKICLLSDYLYEKPSVNLWSRNSNDSWSWFIYDATTGTKFELRDITCPLKTVHYVFDDENIWVNVQSSQECESVSFDFTRSSDWQQVFDKNIFIMKLPPVTDAHLYMAPVDVENLKQKLEGKIKSKIQKWRSHMKTIWNRYCSSLLREVLPLWEYWSFNPTEPKPGLGQRLRQLMVTYKIYGFPLNFPYVNMKTTLATIKSTCLHVNKDPAVEFGLAVDVYNYPNGVISVWVFLASITRI